MQMVETVGDIVPMTGRMSEGTATRVDTADATDHRQAKHIHPAMRDRGNAANDEDGEIFRLIELSSATPE